VLIGLAFYYAGSPAANRVTETVAGHAKGACTEERRFLCDLYPLLYHVSTVRR